MVTTSTPSPDLAASPDTQTTPQNDDPGFFGLLVKSVFEPGVNSAVVMAMNVSFFCLILVLFALAILTGWNKHVLILIGCTTLLWGTMMWFVMELTRVQNRPDNMPPATGDTIAAGQDTTTRERKKDR